MGGVGGREGSWMVCSGRMGKTRAEDRWASRGQVPGGLRALDSKQYSVSCSLLVLLSASTSRAGEEARDMGP